MNDQQYNHLLQVIAELSRQVSDVSTRLDNFQKEMYAFRAEMYAFRDEMYSFRTEMYAFQKEMYAFIDKTNTSLRIVNKKLDKDAGDLISNVRTIHAVYSDHDTRIIKLEKTVFS